MRRQRSVVETLGAIVLIFESVVVFLGALVTFGLRALAPEQALIGGAILVVALFASAGLLRWRAGIYFATGLQIVVLLSGLLVPAMWFVGAVFSLLWGYAVFTGNKLDTQKPETQNSPNQKEGAQ